MGPESCNCPSPCLPPHGPPRSRSLFRHGLSASGAGEWAAPLVPGELQWNCVLSSTKRRAAPASPSAYSLHPRNAWGVPTALCLAGRPGPTGLWGHSGVPFCYPLPSFRAPLGGSRLLGFAARIPRQVSSLWDLEGPSCWDWGVVSSGLLPQPDPQETSLHSPFGDARTPESPGQEPSRLLCRCSDEERAHACGRECA